MTKVFVVLTSVLSIALSCMFIAAAAQWDNYRQLSQDYQRMRDAEITRAQNTAANMFAELAMKDESLSTLRQQLSAALDAKERLTDANADLENRLGQTENERLAFQTGQTKLQETLDAVTAELRGVRAYNGKLLSDNSDLQSRNIRLNSRTLELTTTVTILQDEARNIQEKLYVCEQDNRELQKISAAQPRAPAVGDVVGAVNVTPTSTEQIKGQVVDAGENYATINVGETSGVTRGMSFMIYRSDGGYLGDLVIETVRPREAGGRVTTNLAGEIRKGDQVVFGIK